MSIDLPSSIVSRVPVLVVYIDRDLRYRFTNEAYREVLGVSPAAIEGRSVLEVLPEKTRAVALPHMRAALDGQEVEFDSPVEIPGSPRKLLRARYIPDHARDGSVAGFFAILTDVTEQTEAEAELRRVTALCDGLPTLLAHCDAEQRYLFVNRAYAETYGRTKEEVLGRRVEEVVPAELYEVIAPRIRQLLQGRRVDFEASIPHADGARRWMAVRGIPETSGSKVVGFFVNISDVSKHKELEELRSEFAVGIVRAQEAERRALAQELHDGIGQELAALAVLSNALEAERAAGEDSIGAKLHRGLQRAVAEVRRLSYGLHPLELSGRGLVGAIEEFLDRTRAAHTGVTIDLEHAGIADGESLGPEVDIAVYRIVQEAVGNALRHAHPSRIVLSVERVDGYVEGRVSDDGSGFEPTSSLPGLGLPSMRQRAKLLGGSLRIESGVEGTSIGFRFPVEQG